MINHHFANLSLKVKKYLSPEQYKLYDLIWSRALSSQMQSAQFDRNTITITSDNKETILKTTGSVIKFDGYLKIYKDPKMMLLNLQEELLLVQ